jgi:hypothetical protein
MMKADPASLERLNDIVVPPPIPWWPPAPGWYVVLALTFTLMLAWAARRWARWRRDAYRRAALRELESAGTAEEISEILRRTALVIASRNTVAAITGAEWPGWLETRARCPQPASVRERLSDGPYRRSSDSEGLHDLRQYAACWIRSHESPHSTLSSRPSLNR